MKRWIVSLPGGINYVLAQDITDEELFLVRRHIALAADRQFVNLRCDDMVFTLQAKNVIGAKVQSADL